MRSFTLVLEYVVYFETRPPCLTLVESSSRPPARPRRMEYQLLKYEGYDFAHPRLAPPLRPMVAHEVSLEAMRQAEVSETSAVMTSGTLVASEARQVALYCSVV